MKKPGLYANIHAKRKRIAGGSNEKMRKPGSKGAPNENKLADQLTEDSKTSQLPPTRFVAFTEHTLTTQHRKNLALAALVQSWLDDETSNDAEVGPELDRVLRENPLRLRE